MQPEEKPPLVFISYSWDSLEHKQWVLKFADLLILNGVDVLLDQYELSVGKNMFHFMEQSVSNAGKVIMLFTENYATKADKKITKIFTAITGGTVSLAMLKEWLQIQISAETLALLKLILPTLLVLGGVAILIWFVAEKVTNWKITKLTADINSDKSRHDISISEK